MEQGVKKIKEATDGEWKIIEKRQVSKKVEKVSKHVYSPDFVVIGIILANFVDDFMVLKLGFF